MKQEGQNLWSIQNYYVVCHRHKLTTLGGVCPVAKLRALSPRGRSPDPFAHSGALSSSQLLMKRAIFIGKREEVASVCFGGAVVGRAALEGKDVAVEHMMTLSGGKGVLPFKTNPRPLLPTRGCRKITSANA